MPHPALIGGDCFRIVEHNGAAILVVDFTHCSAEELARRAEVAGTAIRSCPPRSILALTLLEGTAYDKDTMAILSHYATKNTPHILAAAAVWHDRLSLLDRPFSRMTGRRIRAFDDERSARDYLAAEKLRSANTSPQSEQSLSTDPDPPIRWIDHDGERILVMDLGNCDAEEIRKRIHEFKAVIHNEPERSIIALNLLDNFPFGRDVHAAIIDWVKSNRPYVIAAAAVGLGYMKPAIPVLNRFTGRNIRAFDDEDAAKNWLVSEKRRILGD